MARVEPVEPGADTVETTGVTAPVRVGVDGELVSWAGAECSHVVTDAGQLLGDGLVVVGQRLQTHLYLSVSTLGRTQPHLVTGVGLLKRKPIDKMNHARFQ